MPIRRMFLRGPLGGYRNDPDITNKKTTGADASFNIDIRPPAGQIWAPTFVKITAIRTAGTGNTIWIAIYDGTTAVYLAYDDSTAAQKNITFGSAANGPILLTRDKYMRLHGENVAGTNTDFYAVASVSKVI